MAVTTAKKVLKVILDPAFTAWLYKNVTSFPDARKFNMTSLASANFWQSIQRMLHNGKYVDERNATHTDRGMGR